MNVINKIYFFFISLLCCSFCTAEKAVVVVDAETMKPLYTKNAHAQHYPASLTKKMTLYLLFEALKEGKVNMNTQFKVSYEAVKQRPSKLHLKEGELISVRDLIQALVVKSANDAAVVAAEGLAGSHQAFVEEMNDKAKELGMHNTTFKNATGWHAKGQVCTAHDMMVLGVALFRHFPEHWHLFSRKYFTFKGHTHANHNKLLFRSSQVVDGIKTGYTVPAGFNLSTSAYANIQGKMKRIFVVYLGGKTARSRDNKVRQLVQSYLGKSDNKPDLFLLSKLNNMAATNEDDLDLLFAKKKNIVYKKILKPKTKIKLRRKRKKI